jgi:hypothetical protein
MPVRACRVALFARVGSGPRQLKYVQTLGMGNDQSDFIII